MNILRAQSRWRDNRRVHRGGSTSVDRCVEDYVVFFWIRRFDNQNRSILEDLNRKTWFLRGGRATRGVSPASSGHYFGEWSSNYQPLCWRNVKLKTVMPEERITENSYGGRSLDLGG